MRHNQALANKQHDRQSLKDLQVIVGELTVPKNDNTLGITATAGNQQQIATFTQAELNTINELVAWWNRPVL